MHYWYLLFQIWSKSARFGSVNSRSGNIAWTDNEQTNQNRKLYITEMQNLTDAHEIRLKYPTPV